MSFDFYQWLTQLSDTTMTAQLYILSAPSGAGKTSMVREACSRIDVLTVSVSHTTRPKRPKDRDGVDYHFVEKPTFLEMIAEADFLEHAEVFGNYYGTSHKAITETLNAGKDVLLEIDWQGADQVRRLTPEACSIFIMPPSRETLENRLRGRASDSEEVIERRIAEAVSDMQHYSNYDYLIINDDFEQAVSELCAIIIAKRVEVRRQTELRSEMLSALLG